LLAIILYNYTEAAFVSVSVVWTMFFLIAVDYPPIGKNRLGGTIANSSGRRSSRIAVPA
jgi:hypothetical protein